jgi:hypothetical protein
VAEQEIAKHTKNVISLVSRNEHGWRHKLSEAGLEIITIMFAVSLSIWLHGLGEHHHEQEQVRDFLLGLRHDLQSDLENIAEVEAYDHKLDANFAYLGKLDPAAAPDPDKFPQAYDLTWSNIFFTPSTSRYEGFKSAGRLGNIENDALTAKMLELYESDIKHIQYSETAWSHNQRVYHDYLEKAQEDGDESMARHYRLLTSLPVKRLLKHQVSQAQLYQRYETYAKRAREIIQDIEREYPSYIKPEAPAPKV